MSTSTDNPPEMCSPVIVMGMMRSGTTLLAEMVHKGGTPMFDVKDAPDPSYDRGIRYERPVSHEIDHEILGLSQNTIGMKIVGHGAPAIESLHSISEASLKKLHAEVGHLPWGFKNPRTTLTYPKWREAFPEGATFYIHRCHQEVLRYHYNSRKNPLRRLKRMRMAASAWVIFNERLLENIELDRSQNRPHVLVGYEELMEDSRLIGKMQEITEVPLFDARDSNLHRNRKCKVDENFYYKYALRGLEKRLQQIGDSLERTSLKS